jgi:hypothetical protein
VPTRVRTKLMSPQRFRVEEAGLPGEGVSGIMDERPKLDSGRLSRSVMRVENRTSAAKAVVRRPFYGKTSADETCWCSGNGWWLSTAENSRQTTLAS